MKQELKDKIRNYYRRGWKPNTIAKKLDLKESTVISFIEVRIRYPRPIR